ncbi:MAG: alanine racemase [Rikenellaceae bacterium]|nr:alanine racemase [Rikenellaceae bacterium]
MRYFLSDIARICGGELVGEDLLVTSVVTDSRTSVFAAEALFVAMCGKNHDSHDYVPEMLQRGVQAFMVERDNVSWLAEGVGYVRVNNSLEALQQLASAHRKSFSGRVVGITGSNGKTIVKEWIARSLPTDTKLFTSPMSYNSQLGVALSLLMIEGDEDVAIIEAGISEVGEMQRLESMIQPDTVVFTSIGDAHQSNFSSLEEKIREKLILARNATCLIYHSHYPELQPVINQVVSPNCRVVDAADAQCDTLSQNDVIAIDSQLVKTLCREVGYECQNVEYRDMAMRLEVKEGIAGSKIINDSYNSDINSLTIALEMLSEVALGGRKVAIISDILQSGMSDEQLYARVAALVNRAGVDLLIGVGEKISSYAHFFESPMRFYATTDELLLALRQEDIADSTVLLKGNRSSHFERVCHRFEQRSHTTVLEVNLAAMTHNISYFRRHLPKNHKLVAMVKASSYGAGDVEVAQLLQHQGINYLAVAFADEGITLREKGITMPIVVLNADAGSFDKMVSYSLEPEIYSFTSLKEFSRSVERYGHSSYPIHLKLDTGMHRLGFVEEDMAQLIDMLKVNRYVKVASIFAHLACADMPEQDDYTRGQIELFDKLSMMVANSLPYKVLRHTANSAAIERFPEAAFDMCRLGLGLYGYGYCHNEELQVVSTLRSRVVQLRCRKAGESIGYARSQVLERDSLIATIPVGYADGLDRHLGSGAWSMLVAGKPAPIVGRVCMDSCMIDVTDIEGVQEGSEVLIFSANQGNTAEDMARVLGTIPYEIISTVASRVKRVYVK